MTRDEVTEWHRSNAKVGIEWSHSRLYGQDCWQGMNMAVWTSGHELMGQQSMAADYTAANRYLDSTGYRRPMNESL